MSIVDALFKLQFRHEKSFNNTLKQLLMMCVMTKALATVPVDLLAFARQAAQQRIGSIVFVVVPSRNQDTAIVPSMCTNKLDQ